MESILQCYVVRVRESILQCYVVTSTFIVTGSIFVVETYVDPYFEPNLYPY